MNAFHRVSRLLLVATVVFVGHANASAYLVDAYKYAADTRLAGYAVTLRNAAKDHILTPHATGLIAYVMQDAVSSNVHVKDLFVAAGDSALGFLQKLRHRDTITNIVQNGIVPTVAGAAVHTISDMAKKFLCITVVRQAQEMMKEVASPADFVAKQYNETVPAFPGKKQVGKIVSAVYSKVTDPQVFVLGGMDAHHAIMDVKS